MRATQAFTLIELAVVLVIVSLMVGFGLQAFQSTTNQDCAERTTNQLQIINRAMQRYVVTNKRYPKPASLAYGSNNASFGLEETGGVSASASAYATTAPASLTSIAGGTVLRGALPHVELKLPVEYASDCWGNKFTYVVTNTMTSSNTSNGYPSTAVGALTINTNTLASPSAISTQAMYIIVSHGPDQAGATPVTFSDITARSCTVSAGTKTDTQNCDTGNSIFFDANRMTGNGAANYFDDFVVYANKPAAKQYPCRFTALPFSSTTMNPTPVLTTGDCYGG